MGEEGGMRGQGPRIWGGGGGGMGMRGQGPRI